MTSLHTEVLNAPKQPSPHGHHLRPYLWASLYLRMIKRHCFKKDVRSFNLKHPERVHCPPAARRPGPVARGVIRAGRVGGRVWLAGPSPWRLRGGGGGEPARWTQACDRPAGQGALCRMSQQPVCGAILAAADSQT